MPPLLPQRPQRDAGHFHDLEPHARDVADGVAAAAKPGDEDLVLFSRMVFWNHWVFQGYGNGEHERRHRRERERAVKKKARGR